MTQNDETAKPMSQTSDNQASESQSIEPKSPEAEEERLRLWREERKRVAEEQKQKRIEERKRELSEKAVAEEQELEDKAAALMQGAGEIAKIKERMGKQRKRGLLRQRAMFLVLVVAPLIVAVYWLTYMAEPLYKSTSVISISKPQNGNSGSSSGLLGALGSSSGMENIFTADTYVRSQALLEDLKHGSIRSQLENTDLASVLDMTGEQLANYVTSSVDIQTNMMTLYVSRPKPEQAVSLSNLVLGEISRHVEKLDASLSDKRLEIAQMGVTDAETKLTAAKKVLVELQVKHDDIDPRKRAESIYAAIAETQTQISALRSEIDKAVIAGKTDSFQAQRDRELLARLQEQVAESRKSLVDQSNNEMSLNELLMDFEMANQRVRIAEEGLSSALSAMATAQSEVALDRSIVQIVVPPLPPVSPSEPKPYLVLLMTLLVSLSVFLTARQLLSRHL